MRRAHTHIRREEHRTSCLTSIYIAIDFFFFFKYRCRQRVRVATAVFDFFGSFTHLYPSPTHTQPLPTHPSTHPPVHPPISVSGREGRSKAPLPWPKSYALSVNDISPEIEEPRPPPLRETQECHLSCSLVGETRSSARLLGFDH